VGSPCTSDSWKKPKRRAVDTVWLQATLSLKPIWITGRPRKDTPLTFASPSMVSCAW